jgi:hypothetical protein
VYRREDMSGTDDAELGKGRDQHFKDRLHYHMGMTPGDVQEGADGAFRRAVRAQCALSNCLTTRFAARYPHGVHVHGGETFSSQFAYARPSSCIGRHAHWLNYLTRMGA